MITAHTESEKALSIENKLQRLRTLYLTDRKLFFDIIEYLPYAITINEIDSYNLNYVSQTFEEFTRIDSHQLLEHGFSVTRKLVDPDNLAYQLRLLDAFKIRNDKSEVLQYLQLASNAKSNQRDWYFTYKMVLGKDSFLNFHFDLSIFGKDLNSLSSQMAEAILSDDDYEKFCSLTKREKELAHGITTGLTNQEIADNLFISKNTVRTHRNRIWKKLGIKKSSALDKYRTLLNP